MTKLPNVNMYVECENCGLRHYAEDLPKGSVLNVHTDFYTEGDILTFVCPDCKEEVESPVWIEKGRN